MTITDRRLQSVRRIFRLYGCHSELAKIFRLYSCHSELAKNLPPQRNSGERTVQCGENLTRRDPSHSQDDCFDRSVGIESMALSAARMSEAVTRPKGASRPLPCSVITNTRSRWVRCPANW